MPAMSGIEVLELLRESPSTKDLPVIVLSNVRDDRVVRHLLKLGCRTTSSSPRAPRS
jgi:CheY-like chemotaxis protein